MTTRQFEESVNAEIKRMMENKAVQVCSAGEWPELPTSFSEWLERNNDSIECCENCTEIDKRIIE